MAAWFFVQVWVLCLVAFLLGAAVTWLVFVRPLRRRSEGQDWPELRAWPRAESPAPQPVPAQPDPVAGPVTDPALSALDATGRRVVAGPGVAAVDALDQLGVVPPIPEQSTGASLRAPDIPAQSGPAER